MLIRMNIIAQEYYAACITAASIIGFFIGLIVTDWGLIREYQTLISAGVAIMGVFIAIRVQQIHKMQEQYSRVAEDLSIIASKSLLFIYVPSRYTRKGALPLELDKNFQEVSKSFRNILPYVVPYTGTDIWGDGSFYIEPWLISMRLRSESAEENFNRLGPVDNRACSFCCFLIQECKRGGFDEGRSFGPFR